ncbi:MAG: hypothetical protein L0Y60_11590, partial [Beijerinckiaceae bacterium]|nr:hypothetical protein [Beijerinckiaceae bacterium]
MTFLSTALTAKRPKGKTGAARKIRARETITKADRTRKIVAKNGIDHTLSRAYMIAGWRSPPDKGGLH